jgi:hypothetical protein
MSDTYHVVLVRPAGYVHADAVAELAQTTYHGLRRLGIPARLDAGPCEGERQIIYGAHLFDAPAAAAVPSDAIIYNTEQMTAESAWLGGA